jgi:acetyl-CoA synthetase (ADP-forming)
MSAASGATALTIRRLFHPRSVAVIGASDNPEAFGGRVMRYVVAHRFPGRVFPINPGRSEVLGIHCYPNLRAASEPVDVAMLAVPRRALEPVLHECGEAGVACCIVPTTGFAEAGGSDDAAAEARLVAIGRQYGMRLVGPNCLGIISPHARLALNASTVMETSDLTPGPIGLISQSGALMVSIYDRARAAGIGFSACVSVGNQADLEVADFLEYMVDDPDTRAVCAYVEGFKDPGRLLRVAEAAREARKPVIMYKLGRTAAGVRAAATHTASLAGDFAIVEAAFRERGVVLTDDPHDGMVEAADLLARWGEPSGEGVAVVAPSGGGMSIMADRLTESGLRLATLQEATKEALRTLLRPPQADNPLDLGGRLAPTLLEMAGHAMAAVAADPDVSANVIVLSAMPGLAEVTRELARTAIESGKPTLAMVMPAAAGQWARTVLRELGCPFFDHMDHGLRALRIWAEHRRLSAEPVRAPAERPSLPTGARKAAERARPGTLTEPDAKALLEAYGIPVNAGLLAATEDEMVAAARAVGYPVALKAVSPDIVHKAAAGTMRLDLADDGAVRGAFLEITEGLRHRDPPAVVIGYLVQSMVAGEAELIVGIHRDPQFGPVVLAGSGGVLAEIVADLQIAMAPVSFEGAMALLRRLRLWPVLAGVRGGPALDLESIGAIVTRMSWLAVDLGDRLIDLEANPVRVGRAGGGAVVVDARGTLAESGHG